MKAYKGFDKDLKCRGFQYEIGEEYTEDSAIMCEKGFHACEYPLDCFRYYTPANSRYCEVEIDDNGQRQEEDTKVCGKHIKIGAELDIKGLVHAAFEYTKERCTNSEQGGNHSALQGGDYSALQGETFSVLQGGDNSALQGETFSALQGGYDSALKGGNYSAMQGGHRSALQGGYCSALQGGDNSALQGGNHSALQGGYDSALKGGNYSAMQGGHRSALQGGDYSVIYGGRGSKVKGGVGAVLAIEYWADGAFLGVKSKIVDGEKIKADTWYKLDKAGRFIECKEG